MKTKSNNLLRKYNNNNGIALISILIAVAFISIIGSALLYITYSNFQMKVMNNRSKTNFYETDGELVNATSALRAYCDNPSKAGMVVTATTDTTTYPTGYKYDITNALQFAGISNLDWTDANGDHYTIKASGTAEVPTEENNISTYTLNDLAVTQKSSDGYVNTVKTDVVLKLKKQTTGGGGKKGLGDCSMICDSQITVAGNNQNGQNTQFGFITLFGDAYFSNYYYGADGSTFKKFNGAGNYTMPGDYRYGYDKAALYLTKDAKINFESDYMSVYGDLVLTGNSCLNISKGNLTVYGDIYLLDHSTLICNGTIYQPKTAMPGREATPCFRSAINVEASADYLKAHLFYPNGAGKTAPRLAVQVEDDSYTEICKLMNLNDTVKENDGITPKICTKIKYTNNDGKDYTVDYLKAIKNTPNNWTNGKITSSYYGVPCGIAIMNAGAQVGNIEQYQNYIVFVTANGYSGKELNMNGSNIGSTLVSASPIYINVQSGVYFSKMGSEIYDYLTIKSDKTTNPYYNSTLHHFELKLSGAEGVDASGNKAGMNDASGNYYSAGDFLDTETNTHIQTLFLKGVNGGSGGTQYINSISFKGYEKDAD